MTLAFYPAQVCATIQDNGVGFELNKVLPEDGHHAGWGLLGIQERTLLLGGQYAIDSKPGQGTCIQVKVPVLMETEDVENTTVIG